MGSKSIFLHIVVFCWWKSLQKWTDNPFENHDFLQLILGVLSLGYRKFIEKFIKVLDTKNPTMSQILHSFTAEHLLGKFANESDQKIIAQLNLIQVVSAGK